MNKSVVLSGVIVAVFLISGCGRHKEKTESSFEPEEVMEDMNSTLSNEVTTTPAEQTAETNGTTVAPEPAAAYDPNAPFVKPTTQEVQEALKNAGLYTGKVDGVVGPRSKKAIRDFQEQNGLNPDGRIGPQTWAKLAPYLHQSSAAPTEPAPAAQGNAD
jgi:peptidoglycan hydrolase-like protein with peptidoglycan-binding domain